MTCKNFPEFKDCNKCGGKHDGYSKDDGCLSMCINGVEYKVESLTEDKNKDNPLDGRNKVPPTWSVESMCVALKKDRLCEWGGEVVGELTESDPIAVCVNGKTVFKTLPASLHVTGSTCADGKIALVYSDGSEVVTPHDCPELDTDTRLEMGEPVVAADGTVTIPYETINVLTGDVVSSGEIVIPELTNSIESPDGSISVTPVEQPNGSTKFEISACPSAVEPTFVTKCVASGGGGTPFDGIMVDGSLTSGDGAKKIQFLPADDVTYPLVDAAWVDAFDADNGVISDAELVESGGLVRVGVEPDCGWEWSVQSVSSCSASKKATGIKPQEVMFGSDYSFGDCEGLDWDAFVECVRCSMGCDVNVSPQPDTPPSEQGLSAGYHVTMLKTVDGVAVSGEGAAPTGSNQLLLTEITSENGYNYTGDIIDFKAGGTSFYSILTSEGLWSGSPASPFSQKTIPAGLSTVDVSEYHILEQGVFTITTKSGEVFVSTDIIGGVADANGWYKQPISDVKKATPIIESIASPFNHLKTITMFAEKDNGELWTWGGGNELVGDGTAPSLQPAPIQMTNPLPAGASVVKLEGVQRSARSPFARDGLNYLLLGSNGKVYALGDGRYGINGQDTEADQYEWVTVKSESGNSDLTGIVDISGTNHAHGAPYVMAMTYGGDIFSWGLNTEGTAGSSVEQSILLPRKPDGSTQATAISAGGHISPYLDKSGWYCNIGHNKGGGFGDGTIDDRDAYECYPIPVDIPLSTVEIAITGCKDGDCVNAIDYTDAEGNPATIELECC